VAAPEASLAAEREPVVLPEVEAMLNRLRSKVTERGVGRAVSIDTTPRPIASSHLAAAKPISGP
jgi:hypothetical protein